MCSLYELQENFSNRAVTKKLVIGEIAISPIKIITEWLTTGKAEPGS
jgi:hypothetical protein